MSQFSDVSSKYGAPMGRRSYGTPEGPATLFKVIMVDGDYDDGGAYWGGGTPLYCLRTDDSEHFYRAFTRDAALAMARKEFPNLTLVEGVTDEDKEAFLAGYMREAMTDAVTYESDTNADFDDSENEPEFDPSTVQKMTEDCNAFLTKHGDLIIASGMDMDEAGALFWFDRNGAGVGFWDKHLPHGLGDKLSAAADSFGTCDVYMDDGKIYA